MKVVQVIANIDHQSSGTSTVVPRICESLSGAGAEVELHTLSPLPERDWRGVRVIGHPRTKWLPYRLGCSASMKAALPIACRDADVVQTNGLWMMQNIYPDKARAGTVCKFVIMTHGTLNSWALKRSGVKKWIALHLLGQSAALRHADMFVATCEKEYEEIRKCGYRQPVVVVSMGIDIPEAVQTKCECKSMQMLAFLGRIHPVKGVDNLLKVWRAIQDEFPQWGLKIAGPINDYARALQQMAQDLGCLRCEFVGEVGGADKDCFYENADLFVLPSHTENFGAVVAEALAHATPVIATKGAPWPGLKDHQCGDWIDIGVEPLIAALRKYLAKPRSDLISMGKRGRGWMHQDFSWDKMGSEMLSAYEWLVHGGGKPDCVRID